MREDNFVEQRDDNKDFVALYSTFSQLSIHYSSILNNHRILVFSVCTVLLAVAGNVAFNQNTNNSLYFKSSPVIQTVASILILLFAVVVNYSIHQMLVVIHDKYNLVEENLIALEKKLDYINFGKKNKRYRERQSRFRKIVRYYGTVYVIYFSCAVLFVAVIVSRLF